MPDQGFPSQPPVAPVPPAAAEPSVPPASPQDDGARPEPPRRSRAWIWWTLGAVLVIAGLVTSCAFSIASLGGSSDALGAGISGDAVAVIYIDGVIAGTGDPYGGYVTPEYFQDQLQQAIDDESVKAIVLRVDSPGGTVAASEEIASYVKDCDKPVVVSSGDVNASGAYMVSSQADQIWALPGTAVGSIGVISEIPNVSGLLDKVGVEFQVITAGKYKDAGSPYRPLTEEERALIQGEVDNSYEQFIDIVAEGRDMPRSEVESLATGWAWDGDTAKGLGLVDKLGTMQEALDAAARAGGIKGDYDTITYEEDLGPLLSSLVGLTDRLDTIGALMQREDAARSTLPH